MRPGLPWLVRSQIAGWMPSESWVYEIWLRPFGHHHRNNFGYPDADCGVPNGSALMWDSLCDAGRGVCGRVDVMAGDHLENQSNSSDRGLAALAWLGVVAFGPLLSAVVLVLS